jgi:hypothetical protein
MVLKTILLMDIQAHKSKPGTLKLSNGHFFITNLLSLLFAQLTPSLRRRQIQIDNVSWNLRPEIISRKTKHSAA